LNDVTLPPARGFPLQLVAESKYGYKWAKWVVRIEVVKGEVKGTGNPEATAIQLITEVILFLSLN